MEENEENFHRNHLALKVPRVPAASHFAATCTLPLFLPCRTACSRLSASLTPSRSRKIRGRSKRSVAHEQRSAACAPSTVQLARHASRVTTSCPRAVRLPGCLPHGTCPLCPAEGSAAAADRGDAAPEGHARSDRHEEQQLSSRPCSGPSAAGHHRRRGAARPAGVANAPAPNQRCPVELKSARWFAWKKERRLSRKSQTRLRTAWCPAPKAAATDGRLGIREGCLPVALLRRPAPRNSTGYAVSPTWASTPAARVHMATCEPKAPVRALSSCGAAGIQAQP